MGKGKASQVTVFLDRDGVIDVDRPDYVKSWSEFRFLPRVFESLQTLRQNKIQVIIITNQSAVNRGLMSLDTLKEIHRKMLAETRKHSGGIEAIYYCPPIPSENCDCRKPKPGMVLKAVKDLDIDLGRSYLVGDSEKDVELAQALDMKSVRISKGRSTISVSDNLEWTPNRPISVKTLGEAVQWILHDLKKSTRS